MIYSEQYNGAWKKGVLNSGYTVAMVNDWITVYFSDSVDPETEETSYDWNGYEKGATFDMSNNLVENAATEIGKPFADGDPLQFDQREDADSAFYLICKWLTV